MVQKTLSACFRMSISISCGLIVGFATTSCSTHYASVDPSVELHHPRLIAQQTIQKPSQNQELIHQIHAEVRGAIWDSCSTLVEEAMYILLDKARGVGANAIQEVNWARDPASGTNYRPHCTKYWTTLVFFPLIFSPYFMKASVKAQAIRAPQEAEDLTR